MQRSDNIKEEVRAASDIVEVVGSYVSLKRQGSGYVGLCPFHNEKTPSFNVSSSRQAFKCFGCGKGGDVFSFLMEFESISFPEALRKLADRANIEIPERRSGGPRSEDYERNTAVLRAAAAYFAGHFPRSPAAEYLSARGISADTAQEFGLGYASTEPGLLSALKSKQFEPDALVEAGLSEEHDGAFLERWAGCLIIPCHSDTGELVGFGAQLLEGNAETYPYGLAINTRLYSIRRVLFGLKEAKRSGREEKEVFLVASLPDWLVMAQAGIRNVVACAGMALTPERVQRLSRFAKRLVIVHDAQPASVDAATRQIHVALAADMRVYTVPLPQGVSVRDVVESDGVEELKELLTTGRRDFVQHIYQGFRNRRERISPEWQQEATVGIAQALVSIGDTLTQTSYLDHAAALLEVDAGVIRAALDKAKQARTLHLAQAFFQDQLFHSSAGVRVQQFLTDRGTSHATMHAFGLGYAPDSWDALKKEASARGVGPEALNEAGLVRAKEKEEGPWYYDRFRGYLMVPITDRYGAMLGFRAIRMSWVMAAGMTPGHGETRFEKDASAYGLYQAVGAARTEGEMLVAQRTLDVLRLHSAGITNAIAPLGQELPQVQIAAIGQLAPRIVVIWGVRSMQPADVRQALNRALSSKLGADVVALPTSSCLEFARKYGEEALRTWLAEERRTFVQEFYDDPESEGRLEQLRAMVERIEDPKTLEHYRAMLAAKDEERRILKALDFAATFFAEQLTGSEEGEGCRTYLADRKLSEDAIRAFGVGYAPDQWDSLLKAAEVAKIGSEILEKAGLVKARERSKGFYDRFRGRVVFPIRSVAGDVIGFGGRILEQAEHAPKYLNTPETPVYKKSFALYGLYESSDVMERTGEAILVEGYTDVLALHQAGISNAVACCGTALTSGQVTTLHRYADELLLLYDADEAGTKAALRAIDLALEGGMDPYAVLLPAGEDPDSFIKSKGVEAFKEYLAQNRQGFVGFIYHLFEQRGSLSTPEGKAEASHCVVDTIGKIDDVSSRNKAVARAAEQFGIAEEDLWKALDEKLQAASWRRPPTGWQPQSEPTHPADRDEARLVRRPRDEDEVAYRSGPDPSEALLLGLMLSEGEDMIAFIFDAKNITLEHFAEGATRRLATQLFEMWQNRVAGISVEDFDPELRQLVEDVTKQPPVVSPHWEKKGAVPVKYNEDPFRSARGAIRQLKKRYKGRNKRQLIRQLRDASGDNKHAILSQLIKLN